MVMEWGLLILNSPSKQVSKLKSTSKQKSNVNHLYGVDDEDLCAMPRLIENR